MKIRALSHFDEGSTLSKFQARFLNEASVRGHEVQEREDVDIVLTDEKSNVQNLRNHFGKKVFLIGIVGTPSESTDEIVMYLKQNHLNLCMAQSNDLVNVKCTLSPLRVIRFH